MVYRLVKLYDHVSGQDKWHTMKNMEEKLSIGAWKFKPNVYYSKCHSKIIPQGSNDARKGQVRDDQSFGFGVVGRFPNIFTANRDERSNKSNTNNKNTENESKNVQKKNNNVLLEEDGELVE